MSSGTSRASAEATVRCPFSLVVDEAHRNFQLSETSTPRIRVALRDLGIPFDGSFNRRVVTRFHHAPDGTEPGREHEEIAFEWDANSWFLPDFSGTLRFRIQSVSETRLLISGAYSPPFGAAGTLFDRVLGHRLARATLASILRNLAGKLEAMWAIEHPALVVAAT